jgi:hypothetical protein
MFSGFTCVDQRWLHLWFWAQQLQAKHDNMTISIVIHHNSQFSAFKHHTYSCFIMVLAAYRLSFSQRLFCLQTVRST